MFELHPAFPPTSEAVGELALCHVRLQADARYPWLVLIPRIAGLRELEDLSPEDRSRLMEEVVLAGAAVRALGEAQGRAVEKLNIGALGNVTPQLHVHVVGRRSDDSAWPGPVWGVGTAEPPADDALAAALAVARRALGI
ncbi:HIT domain-containing protein [Phenylobacterium kunshanense]|uniref:Diadenosine tetraphosphate hydrolase n=1 Tax=Phenylobacterium kunshanense TaxID=1445034 RepID=A0A328BNE4_9CAUL|nr:HIT domain-containing protein [Phenylobacterium kunshanense]RAK67464.1 diadenosine tetraphosphate hydrolase [Phenylobacterium kunshanense]